MDIKHDRWIATGRPTLKLPNHEHRYFDSHNAGLLFQDIIAFQVCLLVSGATENLLKKLRAK